MGPENTVDFAMILFVGLIVHGFFSESINKAPGLIVSHVNYVKKVVFPLDILTWVSIGGSLFHASISVIVLLLFYFIVSFHIPLTVIFLPFVFLPFLFLTAGLVWFIAALGVYLRDVGYTTGALSAVALFLSPVFYPLSTVPDPYGKLLYLNPITFVVEQSRNVLLWGVTPSWSGMLLYSLAAAAIGVGGFAFFEKARKGFADVL